MKQSELTKDLIASLQEAEQLKQTITDGNDINNEKQKLEYLEIHIKVLQEFIKFQQADNPTCPNCGFEHHNFECDNINEPETINCDGCGSMFSTQKVNIVKYENAKK